jgi:hypothetical protein
MWALALKQTQVSSNANPCLRSNVWCTVDRTVQSKTLSFFKKHTKGCLPQALSLMSSARLIIRTKLPMTLGRHINRSTENGMH